MHNSERTIFNEPDENAAFKEKVLPIYIYCLEHGFLKSPLALLVFAILVVQSLQPHQSTRSTQPTLLSKIWEADITLLSWYDCCSNIGDHLFVGLLGERLRGQHRKLVNGGLLQRRIRLCGS